VIVATRLTRATGSQEITVERVYELARGLTIVAVDRDRGGASWITLMRNIDGARYRQATSGRESNNPPQITVRASIFSAVGIPRKLSNAQK
jgi:hypothetical protein